MARALSRDLRLRVLKAADEGASARQAAARFGEVVSRDDGQYIGLETCQIVVLIDADGGVLDDAVHPLSFHRLLAHQTLQHLHLVVKRPVFGGRDNLLFGSRRRQCAL